VVPVRKHPVVALDMMVVANITNMEAGIAKILRQPVSVVVNMEPYVITISMSYAKDVVIVM
jgi:hypothetical protein